MKSRIADVWHRPPVLSCKAEHIQTGFCWVSINHTTGSHRQNGKWRTREKPPPSALRTSGSPLLKRLPAKWCQVQIVLRQASIFSTLQQNLQDCFPFMFCLFHSRQNMACYILFNCFCIHNINEFKQIKGKNRISALLMRKQREKIGGLFFPVCLRAVTFEYSS